MKNENINKDQIWSLIEKLFPIHRTLINEGFDNSLDIINEEIELMIKGYKSGEEVWDWIIPDSWNVNEAYIEDMNGNKLVDYNDSNLHLSAYSEPFSGIISHDDLLKHLNFLPDQPDAIPYNFLYYEKGWSFNIKHNSLDMFKENEYKVHIDVDKKPGELKIAECFLPGEKEDEIVFSTYLCHPSMANDNLSGVVTGVQLFKYISQIKNRKYSYRLLIMPETIGPITYLSNHEERIPRIVGGFVLYCCGTSGGLTYKKSYYGDSYIDQIAEYVCKNYEKDYNVINFFPGGSDERQYNAPGLRLPFGAVLKTPPSKFIEYHTSKDDLTLVNKESLYGTYRYLTKIIDINEMNRVYNNNYKGEPFFKKHNITYPTQQQGLKATAKAAASDAYNVKILASEIDGKNSLLDISDKWEISMEKLNEASKKLLDVGLIS
jgi:aminopeptidase-like protein